MPVPVTQSLAGWPNKRQGCFGMSKDDGVQPRGKSTGIRPGYGQGGFGCGIDWVAGRGSGWYMAVSVAVA